MKTPKRLESLIENGLIDEALYSLKSGKEVAVYVVRCGAETCCAKVYKEADQRSFRQSVLYQEGRKVRNSRRARAMEKGNRYGRKEQESSWQNAEVTPLIQRISVSGQPVDPVPNSNQVTVSTKVTP